MPASLVRSTNGAWSGAARVGGRVGVLAGPGRRANRVLFLAGRPGWAARVDPVEQGSLVVVGSRHRQPGQRRAVVGVLQQVGDLGQQQTSGAVDRAAPAGEPLVGERAGGVGQQHALGPPFHDQAGEPGQVVGQVGAAQGGGCFSVEGRVVGDRVLQQQPPGPARGRFPLGRAFRADVVRLEQACRAGQVLDRPGRAEQCRADVVVDVVEGVAPVRVPGPVLRRPVDSRSAPWSASQSRTSTTARLCSVMVASKPRPSIALAVGANARTRSARLISIRERWKTARTRHR